MQISSMMCRWESVNLPDLEHDISLLFVFNKNISFPETARFQSILLLTSDDDTGRT